MSRERLAAAVASPIGLWLIAAVLAVAACRVAGGAYHTLPRPQPLTELSYYPSGRHLAPATLGHAETAADLAWLRAVQYYGEHRMGDNTFTRMGHIFDILTSLSPHFIEAYIFGGFALAQEGGDFVRAERLMLKGIEANPTSGRLAFELGFLYYVRPGGRDLRNAAAFFAQAARQPDGPPQAMRFAAFARQSSGDLRVAYELWQEVHAHSRNAYLRDMAEREMRRIVEALQTGDSGTAIRKLSTPVVLLKRGG